MRGKFKIAATLAAGASALVVGCGKKATEDSIAAKVDEAKAKAKALNVDDAEVSAADEELIVPGALALLPAKESGAAGLRLNQASTDLAKHKTFYRTYSRSTEAADKAGQILCFIEQTQFWKFANKGPYVAMVSESKCKAEEGGDGQSGGGQSRQDETMKMVVNVTRADKKPMSADILVTSDRDGDESQFPVRIVVAEAPSAGNPLGIFRMAWD